MRKPQATLGVDCGNHTVRATTWCDGQVKELEDREGHLETPAAIAYEEGWKFGRAAMDSPNAVTSMKSHILDRDWVEGRSLGISASDALKRVLQRCAGGWQDGMKSATQVATGAACPTSFSTQERETFESVFQQAGLPEIVWVNEPEAALIGSRTEDGEWLTSELGDQEESVVVVDVAANRTTASLLAVARRREHLRVDLVAQRSAPVGGEAVLGRLAGLLCERGSGHRENPYWQITARREARNIGRGEGASAIPLGEDLGGNTVEVSLAEWEQEASDELESIAAVASECVEAGEDLLRSIRRNQKRTRRHRYIAAGGGWMLSPVGRRLNFLSTFAGREGIRDATFVVSRGAARYGAMVYGLEPEIEFRSSQRPAIGVELGNGLTDKVLPEDWEEGDTGFRVYTNSEYLSGAMRMRWFSGFAGEALSNRLIAEKLVEFETQTKGGLLLGVKLEATSRDRLRADFRDLRSGHHLGDVPIELKG